MRVTTATKRNIKTRLSVDFPRQDEKITSRHYTLRVTAPEGVRSVDVSIDGQGWMACRHAVGHWWHDWADYGSGKHDIIARIRTRQGAVITSEPHEFHVDLEPHDAEANA